ncbi:MAG: hypothetical protein ACE5GW_07565, partial [Planctomycetota bacterium]
MNPGVEAKEAAALRTAAGAAGAGKRALRAFDGVICFGGEDWWYHNRGHFDMQMMREISAGVPVLYVNSIGMRVPRIGEGGMFFRRLLRKLRSLRRGLVRVRERFAVFTPAAAPGRLGSAVTRRILPFQVRRAARRAGIHRPLIWVACPPAAAVIDALRPAGVVYQRTDRFESFAGVDREQILACDHLLKERADTVIYCSSWLMDEEQRESPRALFVDHGVDFDRFSAAGQARGRDPEDLRDLAHPRVGFIGGIDAHTFDPPLFHEVAARLPEVRFFLVGSSSLPPR